MLMGMFNSAIYILCRVFLFLCMALCILLRLFFFFSSRRRHTRYIGDWSSDVCSSDLAVEGEGALHLVSEVDAGVPADLSQHAAGARHDRREVIGERDEQLSEVARELLRSEERRVGKECRARVWREDRKRKR